jgi:hypothetical protein
MDGWCAAPTTAASSSSTDLAVAAAVRFPAGVPILGTRVPLVEAAGATAGFLHDAA